MYLLYRSLERPCSMLLCIDSAAAGANTCKGSIGVKEQVH